MNFTDTLRNLSNEYEENNSEANKAKARNNELKYYAHSTINHFKSACEKAAKNGDRSFAFWATDRDYSLRNKGLHVWSPDTLLPGNIYNYCYRITTSPLPNNGKCDSIYEFNLYENGEEQGHKFLNKNHFLNKNEENTFVEYLSDELEKSGFNNYLIEVKDIYFPWGKPKHNFWQGYTYYTEVTLSCAKGFWISTTW